MGLRALSQGRIPEARALLTEATEQDRIPRRFRASYAEALRAAAGRDPGVTILDLGQAAKRYLGRDDIPDGRLLLDTMHPNITLHKIIAEAIVGQVMLRDRRWAAMLDAGKPWARSLWAGHVKARYYREAVCSYYFGLPPGQACVERMAKCSRLPGWICRRSARRAWELLFYRGLDGVPGQLAAARELFDHPNLDPGPADPVTLPAVPPAAQAASGER